jgi:hypothetical protein
MVLREGGGRLDGFVGGGGRLDGLKKKKKKKFPHVSSRGIFVFEIVFFIFKVTNLFFFFFLGGSFLAAAAAAAAAAEKGSLEWGSPWQEAAGIV